MKSRDTLNELALNEVNAEFWNELCGTGMARELGITRIDSDSLRTFDRAYFKFYPYLAGYVTRERIEGKRVLEIGLGYGSLGQLLASRGCHYYGLDVAVNPVKMMRYRLHELGVQGDARLQVGSARRLPFRSSSFDFVYSIGCLHHTGSLAQSLREVHRVLVPRGRAVVMLYNRDSFRRIALGLYRRLKDLWGKGMDFEQFSAKQRRLCDSSSQGEGAPHTDFVTRQEVRRLFRAFSDVRIHDRNFDDYFLFRKRIKIRRRTFMNTLGRRWGLDLYITAEK